jgi:hypothetical protein
MASQTQARIALLGGFVFLLGLAISGILRASPTSANSHIQHFETTRGQMGYLLRTVEYREMGISLMAIGAVVFAYAILKKKWR